MTRKGLAASALALLVMAALSGWSWIATPSGAEIALHWGLSGEVNRTAGKAEALLILPAITLGLCALLAAAPHIDPRGRNLKASAPVFLTVWTGLLIVLTVTHGLIALGAAGVVNPSDGGVVRFVLGGVALFIAVIGNLLGKARPNWFLGVRTPWTLSSDKAWDVTHRWAGRGFVASGLAGAALTAFAPAELAAAVFTIALTLTAFGAILLSFLVWRSDPSREIFNEES
ncbi:MAG: SdpI family protein [Oceanicaulis sp.]